MIIPDVISAISLGTSTAQTELSGDRSGNSTDYVVPSWCREIEKVRGQLAVVTPTAGQTAFATLKLQSNDVNFGNYEVFLEPVGGVLSTTSTSITIGQNVATYPLGMDTPRGGERIQFYGQAQIANTAAPYGSACVWLSDIPAIQQYYSIAMSKNNNSSNPVSAGTSAATVAGSQFTVSGVGSRIRALYGVFTSGTIAAAESENGYFTVQAPEIQRANTLRWNNEPVQGFLGTVGQSECLISKLEGLDVPFTTPTTISTSFVVANTAANAGKFEVAMLYQ